MRKSQIIASGGLRTVLEKEPEKRLQSRETAALDQGPKRKRFTGCTEAQTQTQTGRKGPSNCPERAPRKSAFDGERLSWPVSPADWNDSGKLRSIAKDLKSFLHITTTRIASLEADRFRSSSSEYWDQEAAKLFPNGV